MYFCWRIVEFNAEYIANIIVEPILYNKYIGQNIKVVKTSDNN